MAQLLQCDFCGEISNQIAAQVTIDLHPNIVDRDLTESLISVGRSDSVYTGHGPATQVRRDCCLKCVRKFLEIKQVPLAITPEVSEKL